MRLSYFEKDLFPHISFEPINVGEDTRFFLEACLKNGILVYSTSKYNYVYIRYPRSIHHTSTFQEYKLFGAIENYKKTKDFHDDITLSVADIFKQEE
ncbi:hypothetical protein GCM10020331_077770 [Ectobacillus funiculus]